MYVSLQYNPKVFAAKERPHTDAQVPVQEVIDGEEIDPEAEGGAEGESYSDMEYFFSKLEPAMERIPIKIQQTRQEKGRPLRYSRDNLKIHPSHAKCSGAYQASTKIISFRTNTRNVSVPTNPVDQQSP